MNDKDKFKQAWKKVESEYKCFDSLHWLVLSTQTKIRFLLVKEKLSKSDEVELATQIYLLKSLSKLSIVESAINAKNEKI
jgi:hypothetical protein